MPDEPLRLSEWKYEPGALSLENPDRWYLGDHFHRFPQYRPIEAHDILFGWLPSRKLITGGTKVLAIGSCFAEYFIRFLALHGYNRWQLPPEEHGCCKEGLLLSVFGTFENVFVIVQQLRWAFGEFTPESALWFTKDKVYFEATEERRKNIRLSFQEVDVLVVTLGLSEVWFDNLAGEPMWRPITASLYDPQRHAVRRATVTETVEALLDFDRLAERFLPGKPVVFALSPIPLRATFRDQSAVTANQASKAILRAALDEFLSKEEIRSRDRYHYFPSYELAFHLFDNPFEADNRHVRPDVAQCILNAFSAAYTDLPTADGAGVERQGRAAFLEQTIRRLEQELVEKEKVIRELDTAAKERLAIIERLTHR